MALRISHNIAALNAQRHLANSTFQLNKSLERLSSGYRINRAGDDAAGLAISERMRGEIAGLGQAGRNTSQAISLVQTAEGGMNEIAGMLTRLKELAVQASDSGLSTEDRSALDNEATQLEQEIDRIANATKFNNKVLLNGFTGTFQVGAGSTDTISLTIQNVQTSGLGASTLAVDLGSVASAQASIDSIDNGIASLNSARGDLGAFQNRLEYTSANLAVAVENTQAAESVIRDVDMAAEMANFTKYQILVQAGAAMLAQANLAPQIALQLLG